MAEEWVDVWVCVWEGWRCVVCMYACVVGCALCCVVHAHVWSMCDVYLV